MLQTLKAPSVKAKFYYNVHHGNVFFFSHTHMYIYIYNIIYIYQTN